MHRSNTRFLIAGMSVVLGAVALSGCLTFEGPETEGTLAVCVKDAPAEFSAFFVTITQVEVQGIEDDTGADTVGNFTTETAPRTPETEGDTNQNIQQDNQTNDTFGNDTNDTEDANATLTPDATVDEDQTNISAPVEGFAALITCEQVGTGADGLFDLGDATNNTTGDNDTNATGNDTGNQTGGAPPRAPGVTHIPEAGNRSDNQTQQEDGLFDEMGIGAEGNWTAVLDDEVTVDLMEFSGNTTAALLGDEQVPTGTYTQIRMTVSEGWGEDANGQRIDVQVPSGMLQVKHQFTVEEDETTRVVLDFDLDRSLVQAGASGQWILRPVIQADSHVESDLETQEIGPDQPNGGFPERETGPQDVDPVQPAPETNRSG